MKLISHRGNMVGPNLSRENSPSYIDTAISAGYDVEVDINFVNGKFYLGHDTPDYEISEVWMEKRKKKLWFHCKNLESATKLSTIGSDYNFFCHSNDPFVLVSNGYIWVHNLTLSLNNKCIIPLLDFKDVEEYSGNHIYGICTDYILFSEYKLNIKNFYNEK